MLFLSKYINNLLEKQATIPKIVVDNASIHLTELTKRV